MPPSATSAAATDPIATLEEIFPERAIARDVLVSLWELCDGNLDECVAYLLEAGAAAGADERAPPRVATPSAATDVATRGDAAATTLATPLLGAAAEGRPARARALLARAFARPRPVVRFLEVVPTAAGAADDDARGRGECRGWGASARRYRALSP